MSEAMVSLDPDGSTWRSPKQSKNFVFCANAELGSCNWLVPAESGGPVYCLACRHNETIPDLGDPIRLQQWQVIERAKHRLIYALLRLDLPLATRTEDPIHGLSFRFLADDLSPSPVMTGHENGIITISLAEADDAQRELRRTQMHEPYRTLLGHFRHEIGHHYWDLLVQGSPSIDEYRRLFGNERQDYGQSLQRHYTEGPPVNWQRGFISAYATSHPWEDFAETWAHYMHIVDTIETATAFGVRTRPDGDADSELASRFALDAYEVDDIATLVANWIPLALLMNNLNRSMGHPDAYPFVLTPAMIEKLAFIQHLVHGSSQHQPSPAEALR